MCNRSRSEKYFRLQGKRMSVVEEPSLVDGIQTSEKKYQSKLEHTIDQIGKGGEMP